MRMGVCYRDCHEVRLCPYLVIHDHYSCFTSICDLFTDSPSYYGSRDISVGRETRLRAGRAGNRGMIPFMSYSSVIPFDVQFSLCDTAVYCSSVRGKRRSLLCSIQTGSGVHPASYWMRIGVSVPGDKATST
jgi:hypothetical protein